MSDFFVFVLYARVSSMYVVLPLHVFRLHFVNLIYSMQNIGGGCGKCFSTNVFALEGFKGLMLPVTTLFVCMPVLLVWERQHIQMYLSHHHLTPSRLLDNGVAPETCWTGVGGSVWDVSTANDR